MKKILIVLFSILFFCASGILAQESKETQPPRFEQPLLITSAGQSAEVQLASVLAKRAGLDATLSKTATASDLKNIKTVAIVFGTSLKGLGAAGLNVPQEKERVGLLIKETQQKGIPLLALHLGGEARRGPLSDEIITAFLPYAKMAIVTKPGNKDGLFSRICEENNIPIIEVERTVDALAPFKLVFEQQKKPKSTD